MGRGGPRGAATRIEPSRPAIASNSNQSVSRPLDGPSRACRDWGVEVFANADLAAVFVLVARWSGRHCRAAATPLEPFLIVGVFVAILVHVRRSDHARGSVHQRESSRESSLVARCRSPARIQGRSLRVTWRRRPSDRREARRGGVGQGCGPAVVPLLRRVHRRRDQRATGTA